MFGGVSIRGLKRGLPLTENAVVMEKVRGELGHVADTPAKVLS